MRDGTVTVIGAIGVAVLLLLAGTWSRLPRFGGVIIAFGFAPPAEAVTPLSQPSPPRPPVVRARAPAVEQPIPIPPRPDRHESPHVLLADLRGNFAAEGFALDSRIRDGELTVCRWVKPEALAILSIESTTHEVEGVRSLRAWVELRGAEEDAETRADATRRLLLYVAALPLPDTRPDTTRGWVEEHIGGDATLDVGRTRYALRTDAGHTLTITVDPHAVPIPD